MNILWILAAILILGVIITLHELGHFIVGRLCGIGVKEFAVGMGPVIVSREKNGIKYSLRCIPLGGFCAFEGEAEDNSSASSMNAAPAWKRVLTVAAGPFMNFLVAFVLTVVLISTHSISNIYETQSVPYITGVIENMPAAEAGLMTGDIITAVDGNAVSFDGEGVKFIKSLLDVSKSIVFTVSRDAETLTVSFTPQADAETGAPMMGVYFPQLYAQYDCNVIEAVPETLKFMGRTVVRTVEMLGDIIKGLANGSGVKSGSVSGVVGIVSTVSSDLGEGFSESVGYGIFTIAYYIMAISLSLGIMNMLPFPALDGGRLVLLVIEWITGKHLKRETEAIINLAGFAVLIILMIIITFSDVKSLIK